MSHCFVSLFTFNYPLSTLSKCTLPICLTNYYLNITFYFTFYNVRRSSMFCLDMILLAMRLSVEHSVLSWLITSSDNTFEIKCPPLNIIPAKNLRKFKTISCLCLLIGTFNINDIRVLQSSVACRNFFTGEFSLKNPIPFFSSNYCILWKSQLVVRIHENTSIKIHQVMLPW